MQGTIGEFDSLAQAEAAVRALESQNFSIQNVFVADQSNRMWRRLRPLHKGKRGSSGANFLVFMIDNAENIERGRALLRAQNQPPAAQSAA